MGMGISSSDAVCSPFVLLLHPKKLASKTRKRVKERKCFIAFLLFIC